MGRHSVGNRSLFLLIGGGGLTIVVLGILFAGGIGYNQVQDYQIHQSVGGKVSIIDKPGWYLKMFGSVWTYPRAYMEEFEEEHRTSIRATFNDGGTAEVSGLVRFATPTTQEMRLKGHQEFSDIRNVASAVRAHLSNCVKAAAPLMSASEHQSARKAEFTQLVDDMMRNGIYAMRKVEQRLSDETDRDSVEITVFATEIIRDEHGHPVIAQVSPLQQYGIEVLQFSITSTDYDKQTLEKFAAKKEAFQRAEQAKADREQEVQQRLMVIEKGKRELAEIEAESLVAKKKATVEAEKTAEVAEIEARQKVEVARQEKIEAETRAERDLEVARLELQAATVRAETATQDAEAIRTLAAAEEEKIVKAGAITESERVLAEIEMRKAIGVAEKLAEVQVPNVLLMGGSESQGEGSNLTETLINLRLLRSAGIITDLDIGETPAQRRAANSDE